MNPPNSLPNTPSISCSATNPDGSSSPPPSGSCTTSGRTYCPRVQVHQHLSNIIQHKPGAHDMENGSDEHLQMFNIEDSENKTMCVGGIYPTLAQSLGTFNPKDGLVVAVDGSRVAIYNYEWVECIDELIHALNGCTDIPIALQEMADILSCQDIYAYVNVIGINSFCKTRWADHRNQLVTSGKSSPIEDDACRQDCGWIDQDNVTLMIPNTLISSWDRSKDGGANNASKLAEENLCHSSQLFSKDRTGQGHRGIFFISCVRRIPLHELERRNDNVNAQNVRDVAMYLRPLPGHVLGPLGPTAARSVKPEVLVNPAESSGSGGRVVGNTFDGKAPVDWTGGSAHLQ
ncbi:mitochondrial processing peptidase beta subunit [Culex quinquefasciatus]|uniref:Mitochondrial processing peptidase beta subunit n=1 Tax=Culex quinquefasciatus TaxID=7176 RepID=B0WW29_CULQU|nr:mitochondrial processing peptidase beta subunit [Culex quinquefasciatus]|eukprot:XP_001861601.1 mitochondrial processing peptidase beta subunit [Culex quinquefasciatus]